MKYSVLMSVYYKDDPDCLKLALQSIYEEQTRKPDEIVVVFDGPLTKEQYGVLDAFAADKKDIVRYLPQEVNRGLGEALRIGAKECTGDYIFRMDSDDISHPDRFQKQSAYVESHPEIDVLGTDIAEFNQTPEDADRVRACPQSHKEIVAMSRRRNPMNHVTACLKRSALEKVDSYQSLLLVEDYYLWLRMIASGCILENLHESLVFVRVGNGFAGRRSSKTQIASWKKLQQFMIEHKMIGRMDAFINMLTIRAFVYMPVGLKEFVYKKVLRK